jgi:hypothetical protein
VSEEALMKKKRIIFWGIVLAAALLAAPVSAGTLTASALSTWY